MSINIKPGDDLELTYSLPIDFGNTVASIRADINHPNGDLLYSFSISSLSSTAEEKRWRLFAANAITADWGLKTYKCDVLHIFTNDLQLHGSTFDITVSRGETD